MRSRLVAWLGLAIAVAVFVPRESGAQWVRDPDQPLNPTSMAVCTAMADQWQALIESNRAQHQSCLSANERGKSCKASTVEGATCSCPACESLHVEMQSLPRRRNTAVAFCRDQVRAYEKQQREREEAERKRRADAERKRKEEEERKAREAREAEAERKRADEEQAIRDRDAQAARDADDREREREEAEARARVERENEGNQRPDPARIRAAEEAEAARLEREAAEREDRRREQLDRDQRALESSAEMTRIQEELLAKRQAERRAYIDQLAQQAIQRDAEARAKQGTTAAGIADAFAGVKDALTGGASQPASNDVLGGFDLPSSDPTADVIDRLIDHGKSSVPFASIPFELIRSSAMETIAMPDRIFDAIGDMENSDPRMLDDIVNGYPNRVFGPRNFARILTDHWKSGVQAQARAVVDTRVTEPVKREANRRMAEAFRTRNPRALFEPPRTGLPNVRVHGWWTSQPTGRMRTLTDVRGVPMLVDASGKLFRFDASRNAAQYTAEDVPGLIAQHGLRLARTGETEFKEHAIILSPILQEGEDPADIIGVLQKGWAAGEVVGEVLARGPGDK